MSPRLSDPAPLRVGYVLKMYPRLSETFILNEILGLEAAGVDVSIFSLRSPDEGRFHGDLARVRATARYVAPFGSTGLLEGLRLLPDIDAAGLRLGQALAFCELLPAERRAGTLYQALHVARMARAGAIEHLHAHFVTVAAHTVHLVHLLTGIPYTVTAHAKDIYRDTVDVRPFRAVAGSAEALVTVCDANRRFITERLLGGDGHRVVRIYNGLDLDGLPSAAPSRDPHLVLGVGRLVEKKGFDVLLRACRVLSDRGADLRCVLVGDGEERSRLEALRSDLGLEKVVELAGAAPREEVLHLMGRARVLAAPCRTGTDGNRDALPTVLLEALAMGLPVVSTPVAGVPEIVDDGVEGELVSEDDPAALAGSLERLLGDDVLWRRMAAAGPAKVQARFDRRRTLPRLLDHFAAGRTIPLEVPA